jgi:hypothetical protein
MSDEVAKPWPYTRRAVLAGSCPAWEYPDGRIEIIGSQELFWLVDGKVMTDQEKAAKIAASARDAL